ncbi:MAG: immunoglobulin domain-containing protein [Verrucomicrobiota bacterium]
MTLRGGANYLAAPPVSGSVSIANTGPQLLILSAAASGTTMNRGIPGDYAKFLITRLGDTNGPGNSPGNVTPASYTVTNFIYTGTAAPFPTDYTAAAQNLPISGIPVDGTPGIVINPGKVIFTNIIGNPVIHANLNIPPTNVTVIITLTNSAGTNLTSLEGSSYSVSNNAVTLTELDNTVGPETVLWSNPLTNAADSVNWTLTFATTNLGTTTVLPVVLPNYTNGAPESLNGGGSNNFEVTFGSPVASYSVPPSPVMAANGWDKALRMTVNKDFSFQAPSAVNVYPQGQLFQGNYALRFNMFLSLYSGTIDNPVANTLGNEFALFGINHRGTNCNWKPTTPVTLATGGSGTTNSDGMWMAVDAGAGSITPADYDGFAGQPLPNNGSIEPISATAVSQSGVFKRPPFVGADTAAHRAGGTPVNKWVDVSIEVTRQTNLSLFIARSQVLASYAVTNGYTNGTFMLGYLDPLKDVSDPASAFVYYSNVRVIELSPYITNRAISLIVTQGANVSFTSSATYATAPVTNQWYRGTTVPVTLLQTDSNNDTNITSTLSFSNVGTNVATNYYAVFRDVAGSVTGLVATLEVVPPPPNVVTNPGATALIKVIPVGPAPPTSYQWRTNGVNLVNGTHYAGVTTSNLLITNAQAADAITYSVVVSNASGGVEVFTTLTLASVPSSAVVSPANQTNLWGSSATFTVSASGTPPFTYRWKTNGVNLVDGSHYSGATNDTLTVSNITTADAVNYTVGVTNAVGSTLSTVGTLTVFIPAPTFAPGAVSLVGSDVVMSFGSTNIYDGTNAFTLQSSAVVEGPYTNTPATFTTSGGGTFQVTTPQAGGNVFYRLMHKN